MIRMLFVRDEADVLPWNLEWYERLNLPTVVVDDGSTDGSSELIADAERAGSVIASRRVETREYDLPLLLRLTLELAIAQSADALLLTGADEFFEVADGSDLVAALSEDFESGFDVIEFANMEFQMTPVDPLAEPNPVERMRFYTHRPLTMRRGFRYVEGLSLEAGMSHEPTFPAGMEARMSPRAYVSRHYPMRTVEQLRRKRERVRPTAAYPRANNHYLHLLDDDAAAVVDPRRLTRYNEDHAWDYRERLEEFRRLQTIRAFARLSVAHRELEERHMELQRRYAELEQRCDAPASGVVSRSSRDPSWNG